MDLSSLLNLIQWPAMAATLLAAWLVTSRRTGRRALGFKLFIASNFLWISWGFISEAYALIVLQIGLFAINCRGVNRQ